MSEGENPWAEVDLGEAVFDDDGNRLGTIRGFDEDGFFVTIREGMAAFSVAHERAGHEFGEAELTWRCSDCGEVGDLSDGVPEGCPSCDAPKEHLYYGIED